MKSFEEEMLSQQVINFANWSRLDNTISLLAAMQVTVLNISFGIFSHTDGVVV